MCTLQLVLQATHMPAKDGSSWQQRNNPTVIQAVMEVQILPKAFRPKPAQIFGFGLWAPVLGGGLFYMIGDPGAARVLLRSPGAN